MIPAILGALKFAPTVLSLGRTLVEEFTGEAVPEEATPEDVAAKIAELSPEQQAAIQSQLIAAKAQAQELDTQRFKSMVEADAKHPRSTARPEIARRAMGVIEVFAKTFTWLIILTIVEWVLRLLFTAFSWKFPEVSLWAMVAKAQPVTEMIWAPLIASFWVCASIVKKYFGVRERDKAQEFEIKAGRPLESASATVAAAGSDLAGIIKAIRGK